MSKINNDILDGNFPVIIINSSSSINQSHGGKILSIDSSGGAIVLTLPTGLPRGFSFQVIKTHSNQVSFAAGASASIYNSDVIISNAFERIFVFSSIISANEWILTGDLS